MSPVVWILAGVALWVLIVVVAFRWLSNADQAADRFDQVMADHYRANERLNKVIVDGEAKLAELRKEQDQ